MSSTNVYSLQAVPSPAAATAGVALPRNGLLIGAHAVLVTDATVGNRTLVLEILDGATVLARFPVGIVQAASLTGRYAFGGSLDETAFVQESLRTAMAPMPVFPGWTVRVIDTAAISAGDSARLAAAFQD